MGYSIREVCARTGLSAYALRYYEKEGLLPNISRTEGGIRVYTDQDLERLSLICCLKNTEMPLKEISRFVSLSEEGDETLAERCSILLTHQRHIRQRMAEMDQYLETVNRKLDLYTGKLDSYEKEKDSASGTGDPAGESL